MWLWILAILFLLLVWAVWFILQPPGDVGPVPDSLFPTWLAITITVVVVLSLVGLVVYRRIRAARAARALEKAIAQQAQEQVLASKPENRAEIQELQKQMLDGIRSLKASKLGDPGVGGNPLYSLPWYTIVGPPGAGKTTALRHSGLSFPYLDPRGGGVKGVGGTRNCDWWFTNEAILLDTAGRYTTEQEDHDEWMAFLDMLRNYRKHKPLNGIIVAVAINDLIDGTEEDIETMSERIRERIDEMQEHLKMVLPVYVLFTKCDLVAGFVEFFDDIKRSERGQIWGTTFALSQDKSDPGRLFDEEFDLLVEHLHRRSIKTLALVRGSRRDRERVYQFPLEFAAIKRNLSDFMAAAFKPAPPAAHKKAKKLATPILRGFYFTSGTQEGKPLDRVVGAMGRAFGLRTTEPEQDEAREPRSYFLRDVFQTVIFPDQDIAGRTEEEIARVRLNRVLAAALAFVVALVLLIPAWISYQNNQALVAETKQVSDEVGALVWTKEDPRPVLDKIGELDKLRQHLEKLDQYNADIPIDHRWGMYQGEKLYDPAVEQYVYSLRQGFVLPVKARLEARLKAASGANYLAEYNTLKTYLLLNTFDKITEYDKWQEGQLTKEWAAVIRDEVGRSPAGVSESDLQAKLGLHVSYYVALLKRGPLRSGVEGEELDRPLIERVRAVLTRVGPIQAYYDRFVTVLVDQKIDETGPDTPENLQYPPITLNTLFKDRSDVLTKLHSKRKSREGKWQEVGGPYTLEGRKAVLASLKNGYQILEREQWVVPLTDEEKQHGDKIMDNLRRVRQDYDTKYTTEWYEFFSDIDVEIPNNNVEAIQEFKVLSTPEWPYARLLKALDQNTQFEDPAKQAEEEAAKGGVVDQLKRRVQSKLGRKIRASGDEVGGLLGGAGSFDETYQDPVPEKYRSMVEFGFPPAPGENQPPPPSGLGEYIKKLEELAGEMTILEEGPPDADTSKATKLFEEAVALTEGQLLRLDSTGQTLMRDMLLNPLKQSYKAMVYSAGGAASGLWEVVVWPSYRDNIRNRYPFNVAAKRDASFEDAMAFLKPKDGTLWGFYDTYLKQFHRQVGHQFVPSTRLSGTPSPARRYTPFKANLYPCLERLNEISDALFAQGKEGGPGVNFKINLKNVSAIVSEIELVVDGQKRLYRNEKEHWTDFSWPGPEGPPGASITVRGAGGLNETIEREGPWGIYRLFDAGRTTAKKDDDTMFTVRWQFSAPPVVVEMEVKPTRGNHPFAPNFFRDTNCPNSIGDSFGPASG